MPARSLVRFAPLLALTLCAGCFSLTGRVEAELERKLQRAIGPSAGYDVAIEGLEARAGTARRVAIAGRHVRPERAPVFERLDVTLFGVHYDRRAERLRRLDSAHVAVRITAGDLAAYLKTREAVREATVTLSPPDQARLRLRPSIGGLTLPGWVTIDGRLMNAGGHLRFEVEDVEAAGARLGGYATRLLTNAVNPLVDLTDAEIPVALRVSAVRVEAEAVWLEATAHAR